MRGSPVILVLVLGTAIREWIDSFHVIQFRTMRFSIDTTLVSMVLARFSLHEASQKLVSLWNLE